MFHHYLHEILSFIVIFICIYSITCTVLFFLYSCGSWADCWPYFSIHAVTLHAPRVVWLWSRDERNWARCNCTGGAGFILTINSCSNDYVTMLHLTDCPLRTSGYVTFTWTVQLCGLLNAYRWSNIINSEYLKLMNVNMNYKLKIENLNFI